VIYFSTINWKIDISPRKEIEFHHGRVLDYFEEGIAPALSQVW
jgi:hypothetical protein